MAKVRKKCVRETREKAPAATKITDAGEVRKTISGVLILKEENKVNLFISI